MRTKDLIEQTSRPLLCALALAMLNACGGGGGAEPTDSNATPTPVVSTTFSGVLRDAGTRQPIVGATVGVGLKDSTTPASVITGSDGAFALRVETSKLNTASSVVLTVVNKDHRPCTVEIKNLSSAGGTQEVPECAELSAVPAGTFVPPEGAVITRLGDGASGSSVESNSGRLSTLPVGTSKEIKIGAINATSAGSNLGVSVRLKIRGIEAACANKVSIYQTQSQPLLVASGGAGGALVTSDTRGEFSSYDFRLAVSALAATGDLYVRLESGACGAAPADQHGDFEFYDLSGTFTAALPPT